MYPKIKLKFLIYQLLNSCIKKVESFKDFMYDNRLYIYYICQHNIAYLNRKKQNFSSLNGPIG